MYEILLITAAVSSKALLGKSKSVFAKTSFIFSSKNLKAEHSFSFKRVGFLSNFFEEGFET